MISPKMLFMLLVLIYVTPSHEEDPETETKSFSLEKAASELKKLVNENLDKISNYGEEVKEKLKEWKNRNAKGGDLEEDIKDLEVILNNSINNDFKEKENNLYKQLLNITKDKTADVEEKFGKLYKNAKDLLGDAQIYWKNQWNAANDLFKSGVKNSAMTVDQKEVEETDKPQTKKTFFEETDKPQTKKTFFQRFNFLRKIPVKFRKIFREQVDKLKQLAKTVKEKIVKKLGTTKHVKTEPSQISIINGEHRPPMDETKKEDINLDPIAVNTTYQVDKIINSNIETLSDLWTQSKDKDFQPPNFTEFYDNIYNKVNKLIEDIP